MLTPTLRVGLIIPELLESKVTFPVIQPAHGNLVFQPSVHQFISNSKGHMIHPGSLGLEADADSVLWFGTLVILHF